MINWSWNFGAPSKRAYAEDGRGRHSYALAFWKKAAAGGDTESLYQVGLHYESGSGALQSYVEAAKWYRRAAELGHARACARLGRIYLAGGSATANSGASMAAGGALTTLFPEGRDVEPNPP